MCPAHGIHLQPHRRTLILNHGRMALVTGLDGMIHPGSGQGFFASQTCLLGGFGWTIDRQDPYVAAISPIGSAECLGYYLRLPPGGTGPEAEVQAAQEAVELRVTRRLAVGWHEDAELVNHTRRTVSLELALHVQPSETWQELPNAKAEGPAWRPDGDGQGSWRFHYTASLDDRHIHDGLDLRVRYAESPASGDAGAIRFAVTLAPGASWYACLDLVPLIDGRPYGDTPLPCTRSRPLGGQDGADGSGTRFTASAADTLTPVVLETLDQARRDLIALRLPDLDEKRGGGCPPAGRPWAGWTVAAGVPTFMALFGRGNLTAAWAAAMATPDLLRGTLPVLADWQGCRWDDWRDEAPGRMLHEAQSAPEARLGLNPRARYYGSITTSGFYAVALSELWHWTGDAHLAESLLGPAVRALRWLDREARSADGFYYYLTRSAQGQRHQAWKDADDAIVTADGRQVEPPIATCEEQAFVYLAKLHLSELVWRLGDRDGARVLFREAGELRKRFNDAFWLADEGYVAMALDSSGRPVRSIGSNPGHCLATGILDRDRARRVADRMMAPDLFSGWGVRTLSTANPAFNPFSYQRGSVWPVEQATFGIGFMRYGLHDHLQQLSRGFYEAASLFDWKRLPELYAGHARDADHPFPALIPGANSPQAWSSSAVFGMLQSLLGLYPYAPSRLLLLDPHLPSWLPSLTVTDLQVGEATVSLAFHRDAGGRSHYRVLACDGPLRIIHQPSPWSLTATWGERFGDLLAS